MTRWKLLFYVLLGAVFQANGQATGQQKEPALRLKISEVQPGSMSAAHYCMLVFADHSFHAETASRHVGRDLERKASEGTLSDADWSALDGILDSDGFRKLKVPPPYVPLAIQGGHFFTISVKREKGFQNMEFLDDKSRKPYDSQLKPLFHWWKSVRSRRMPASAPVNSECELNNSHGVVSY